MKTDLLSLTPDELEEYVVSLGYPKFRAKQIFEWMYKGCHFDEMSNLPKKLREELDAQCLISIPKIKRKLVSKIDGTVKYLFELHDGNCIESVLMRYKYGLTVCISSQVGCRMGCKFCASTIDGRIRDLTPSELLGQIIMASRDAGERISHVVMMGIGEPLDNYTNVIKFLKLVNLPSGLGISYRSISLSTCGLVPKIYDLAKENLPITLSISLHSANDTARSEIMPINNRYGVVELLCACNSYFEATGRRISFEYTLISGKNDSKNEALLLARTLKKYLSCPLHVNLIPLNPVSEREFKTVDRHSAELFCRTLCENGVNATVRRTLGPDINASCGQLRRGEEKKADSN
jgi:23S rRNA (adenine2503-C2)-methyltransferase